MLMDHSDSKTDGILWGVDPHFFSVKENRTGIGGIKTVGDPHYGRLSRPILAHDRMNRSPFHIDGDIFVSENIAEGFVYVSELQHF
jgi:hypothetical protein